MRGSTPAGSETRPWRRPRWWIAGGTILVAVAALGVVIVAGRDADEHASARPAAGPAAAPAPAAGVPLTVPDIRLTAAAFQGGRQFVLSEHAHKPTILYAMAAWCLTCIPEAKALVQLERELGEKINIIVLDVDPDDTEEMLQHFAKVVGGAPGIWALDKGSIVTRAYNIRSLATTIVIAGGREVSRTFAPQSLDQLRTALAKAQQPGE
ncbi:MAG: thioredoxin family protein [Meiothermus silvanus]|nr:thioredoxin family protein [Allomeiothermus silvanus]